MHSMASSNGITYSNSMSRELLSQSSCQQTYTFDCNANQQHIGILAYNLQNNTTLHRFYKCIIPNSITIIYCTHI